MVAKAECRDNAFDPVKKFPLKCWGVAGETGIEGMQVVTLPLNEAAQKGHPPLFQCIFQLGPG
jgi:hypothetical protein